MSVQVYNSIPSPEALAARVTRDKLCRKAFQFAQVQQGGYDIEALVYLWDKDPECPPHMQNHVDYYRRNRSGKVCKSWVSYRKEVAPVSVWGDTVPDSWWENNS